MREQRPHGTSAGEVESRGSGSPIPRGSSTQFSAVSIQHEGLGVGGGVGEGGRRAAPRSSWT